MIKNIQNILIANRGEIASRIIRTCQKMGIHTVAVFAEADRHAPFVRQADRSVCIGPSEPALSYLDMDKIIQAAKQCKVDAIHPGYGFLSEQANFARRCKEEGIIFIGPNPEAIEAMGSKSEAKSLMEASGVPVIPGYKGKDQSSGRLKEEAAKVGFPVLLKATAGGGGKGMRIVRSYDELDNAIAAAKREAMNAFGNDELLIEKYIESGRHIEFQIFGDQHGQVMHLLERECTIQRRYQKIIEESPSPIMTSELRTKMGQASIMAAKALNYDNAGTVEFIYDDSTGSFYFLEVNTRLQVEHPVTEAITGLDLVRMQIESAQGLPLSLKQEAVKGAGYAIEVRLYAEDPANNFAPVSGPIHQINFPSVEGLRVESAVESGSAVSVFYDPMIAKLIVWGQDRRSALGKMDYVLKHLVCQGITTNLDLLNTLLQHDLFQKGKYDTHFIDNHIDLDKLVQLPAAYIEEMAIAATLIEWQKRENNRNLLKGIPSGWRNNFYQFQKESYEFQGATITVEYRYRSNSFAIRVGESELEAKIAESSTDFIRLEMDGLQKNFQVISKENTFYIHSIDGGNIRLTRLDRFPAKEKEKEKGGYESPMPAKIIKVIVSPGDSVKEGDPLLVISSMKMESSILAEEDGVIESVFVQEDENVEAGYLLLKVKEV